MAVSNTDILDKPYEGKVTKWVKKLLTAIVLIVGILFCLMVLLVMTGFAPRRVPTHVPNIALPNSCTVEIPEELRAFEYEHICGAGTYFHTTVEADPDGGYIIEKSSNRLMSDIVIHITYQQYLELTKLFYDYGIPTLNEDSKSEILTCGIKLNIFSSSGECTDYMYIADGTDADGANAVLMELYKALEEKYEIYGQWSFAENCYKVMPLTEFELYEENGEAARLFKLTKGQDEYYLSLPDAEEIPTGKKKMLHIHYMHGELSDFSLCGISEAELLNLASVVSWDEIWNKANLEEPEKTLDTEAGG